MNFSLISAASYFLPQGVSLVSKTPPALFLPLLKGSLVTAKVVDITVKRFSTIPLQTVFYTLRSLIFTKPVWAYSLITVVALLCLRARSALNAPIPLAPLELTPEQFIEHLKDPHYKFPNCEIIVSDDLKLDSKFIDVNKLPPNLHVKGRLNLKGRTDLISLPSGLHVDYLDLDDCTGLTSLPQDLRIEMDLHAIRCINLISLPSDLQLRGGLNLYGCTSLVSLPSGLCVEQHLHLGDCTNLTSLCSGLYVGGSLLLKGCISLTSLPSNLHIKENLNGCTSLISLSPGLYVGGVLTLRGCIGLTSLPPGLNVGLLDLNGCINLTSLPSDLYLRGDLDLDGCVGLVSLPSGFDVEGSLYLNGCIGLTSLPPRLHVREDLNISGCTGLTSLPSDLDVERDLCLDDCTGLTSLPAWIAQLGPTSKGYIRVVRLAGINKDVIDEFKKRNMPTALGMQFYFSHLAFASRIYGKHPLPLKSGQ